MSNSQIDPIANTALENLIKSTPKLTAKDVMNSVSEEISNAQKSLFPEPIVAPPMAENAISFVYFAPKNTDGGQAKSEEWTVDFDRTTSFCFEWRNCAYLVIQGPYTPICFALRRAFYIGEAEPIGFTLKNRVFIPLDGKNFPSEQLQQDMLSIAGNGNPTSGV